MANNLVRELRINKNGVPVYKWVLPSQGAATKSSVPPPSSTPVPAKAPRGKEICEYLTSQSRGSFGIGNADKLNELSDEYRSRLMEIVQNGDEYKQRLFSHCIQMDGSHLLSMIIEVHDFALKVNEAADNHPSTLAFHHRLERVFQEFNYSPTGWEGDPDQVNEAKAKYLAHALGVNAQTSLDLMVDYDDYVLGITDETDRVEDALPLIMTANRVGVRNRAVSESTVDELVALAEDYPDRIEQMRSAILDRGSVDISLLHEIAMLPSPSLSDGFL